MGEAPRQPANGTRYLKVGPFFTAQPPTVTCTIDLKDSVPEKIYKKIDASNIILEPTGWYHSAWSGGNGNGTAYSNINKRYDPNTGVITFDALIHYFTNSWAGGTDWYVHIIY